METQLTHRIHKVLLLGSVWAETFNSFTLLGQISGHRHMETPGFISLIVRCGRKFNMLNNACFSFSWVFFLSSSPLHRTTWPANQLRSTVIEDVPIPWMHLIGGGTRKEEASGELERATGVSCMEVILTRQQHPFKVNLFTDWSYLTGQ